MRTNPSRDSLARALLPAATLTTVAGGVVAGTTLLATLAVRTAPSETVGVALALAAIAAVPLALVGGLLAVAR